LSGGIYVIVCMAHEAWLIGVVIGVAMVLYQALCPAFLFWCSAQTVHLFSISSLIMRLLIWTITLWVFIVWTDWYSMWIFGAQEGYPLMHPLIPLAQQPFLLCCLPYVGKQILTGLFLLVPVSCIVLLWYRNYKALLLWCSAIAPWFLCVWVGEVEMCHRDDWQSKIKSLPYMTCSTVENPVVVIKIVGNQLKKIITQYPQTEVIIMPESAFNVTDFAELPELIQLWNSDCLGKSIHLIFGASRWHNERYYNSLHWVYDGVLQGCCDKKHAMLISERLFWWGDGDLLRRIYFNRSLPIALSSHERVKLSLSENVEFVPYICSELFFNELPDDTCTNTPIVVIVNDTLFVSSFFAAYIQKLLILLTRFKAVAWQREIVYVSYAQSLFIDKQGKIKEINC